MKRPALTVRLLVGFASLITVWERAAAQAGLAEAVDAPGLAVVSGADTPDSPRFRPAGGVAGAQGGTALLSEQGRLATARLSVTVQGPGVFSWRWMLTGDQAYEELKVAASSAWRLPFTGSGEAFRSIRGNVAWREETMTLPAGPVTLNWEHWCSGGILPGRAAGWLDAFQFTPQGAAPGEVSLPEALDSPALNWQLAAGAQWTGVPATAAGDDYLVLPGPPQPVPADYRALSVDLPPGWFGYRYRGAVGGTTLPPDAVLIRNFMPGTEWAMTCFYSAAGGRFGISPVWNGELILPEMQHFPQDITVAEALDAPGLVWTLSPAASAWKAVPVPVFSADGADMLVTSGTSSMVSVSAPVTGPVEVRFSVSGAVNVWLDAVLMHQTAATQSAVWQERSVYVPQGVRVLRLSTSDGRVDHVRVTPLPELTVEEAVDTSALAWTGAPSAGWFTLPDAGSYDGVDLLRGLSGTATATWSGESALGFRWRQARTLTLDTQLLSLPAQFDRTVWTSGYCELPAGSHQFSPGTGDYDAFTFTAGQRSWREALDLETGGLVAFGNALWGVVSGPEFTGGSALASPALRPGEAVSLRRIGSGNGPSRVRFRWRAAGENAGGAAVATAGYNSTLASLTTGTAWRTETVEGSGLITWTVLPSTAAGCAAGAILLDDVRVEMAGPLIAGHQQALGLTGAGVSVTGSSALPQISSPEESRSGSGALAIAGTFDLTVPVPGPSELSFWWRREQEYSFGFEMRLNGGLLCAMPTMPGWQRAVISLRSAGPHTVVIRSSTGDTSRIFLEGMTILPVLAADGFANAAGGAAVDWAVPSVGAGYAAPDAAMLREGLPGVRLGDGAPLVAGRVTGPGVVRGWWRRELHGGPLRASQNNNPGAVPLDELRREGAWQPFLLPVNAAGSSPVYFHAVSGVPGPAPSAWWLQGVVFEPRALTAGEALGSPELAWSLSPAGAWAGVFTAPAARQMNLTVAAPAGGAAISAPLEGPGFLLQARRANYPAALSFNDVMQAQSDFMPVPAGPQNARWSVAAGTAAGGQVFGPVRFLRTGAVSAAEGMDLAAAGVTLVNGAGLTGVAHSAECFDGEDMAVSAAVDSETPQVLAEFSVSGPARLTWQLRLAGVAGAVFSHARNGAPAVSANITHTGTWLSYTLEVPAGSHSVVFTGQLAAGITGRGYFLLDQMRWESDAAAVSVLAEALDTPGRLWRERADSRWQSLAVSTAAGGSLAATAWLGAGDHTWLETEVTGPGMVFLATSQSYAPEFTATQGGRGELIRGSTVTPMYSVFRQYIADSGPQTLRFRFTGPAEAGPKWQWQADAFAWAPLTGNPSLQVALDTPGLTFGGTWSGIDGGFAGRMAATPGAPAGTELLITTPRRAGTLTWDWLTPTQAGTMLMVRLLDGINTATNSTIANEWVTRSEFLLPRQNQLALRTAGHPATSVALARGFTWTPAAAVTPAEALDSPGITWTSPDWNAWESVQLPSTHPTSLGEDLLISRNEGHGSTAEVSTIVAGPVVVNFTWAASSESADRLEFLADGVVKSFASGPGGATTGYATGGWPVTGSGPHTLTWRYVKNASVHGGDDTAMLRSVTLTPLLSTSLAAALDAPGLTFTTGGTGAAHAFVPAAEATAPRGGSAAVFYPGQFVSSPPQAWLETSLNGTGLLSFRCRGHCVVKVNGVEQTAVYHRLLTVTGTNNWSRVSLPLTDTGSKLIRIEAMASGLAPAVDDFLFEPLSGMPPDSPWISSEPSWSVSAGNLVAPPVTVASWVERTFDGPGLFTATVGATAGTTAGTNTVYLDGIPAIRLAAGTENLSLLVPAGPHTIRFHRSGALSAFQVSEIQFSPAQEPWLPALLDAPQLWFRTSTPYAFPAGTDAPRLPGNAYARWGSAQAGTVAVFAPGTGQFAVSWSRPPGTTPEFGAGFVFGYAESAAAAGQWVHSLSRESLAATWVTLGSMSVTSIGFSNVGVLIPANVHVDGLRFLPRSPDGLTLADAADSDGLTFHPSPDWLPLPFPAYSSDGVDGIVSTAPPGVSPAPLTATVTGPVTLTWAWKAGAGSFGVFVSGQPLQTTASRTFTRAMLQLGPGEHTLEWREVFAGADFVLDQFISRPGSVEREQFSHLLRAAATTDPPGSTWTLLTPGPSLRNYGPYATLNLESGLALLNQSLFQAPLKLEMITEIPVAEALEWNGPLTLEGNWKAYRCASGDFAWTSSSTRLSVTVTGPGVFSWIGGRDNHSVLVNDGPAYYSFDSRGPHRLTFLEEGSRTLTFAWNTWFLETLQWSPLTAQNDFATWAALHGLDPAAPDADADGDGRSAFHEFGFGGNPGQPDDGGLVRPVLVSRPGGATLPAVEFSGRREAGLRYELETLNAAGGWETDATALLELPGPGMAVEWLRLVSSQPVMPGTPRLLRVRTAR